MAQLLYLQCPIAAAADPQVPFSYLYDPSKTYAYLGGRDIQFYRLQDNKTGVVYISTFMPKGYDTEACMNRFAVDAVMGVRNFTAAGVERVLFDTTNNVGGYIVLSQFLQRLFTDEKLLDQIGFQTVLRKTPLAEALAKAYHNHTDAPPYGFDYMLYRNGSIDPLPTTEDMFEPGLTWSINDRTLYTSDLLQDTLFSIEAFDKVIALADTAPFPPENLAFTGNGLCGSACADFTNFLIEYYNTSGYIVSGRPDQPIEYQAFAVGAASDSKKIYSEAQALQFSDDTLLPTLGVNGVFGFTLRANISPNKAPGSFLQYRSYPAEHRFAVSESMFLDPILQWEYAAKQAFPW
jgi:hypothetical protein